LEDCGKCRCKCKADDHEEIQVAKPFERLAGEYAKVQAEYGGFVEANDQFVKDLGNVEPLQH